MKQLLANISPELSATLISRGHKRSYSSDQEVFAEGEHFTSTLARLDADGSPAEAAVAPRFYGTTAEQARRRMIAVLENQYEDVQTVQTA